MPHEHSPPPSPPSPSTDTKLSRKREREVSLEPGSIPATALDTDALREHRETRTPAKKNRTQLDTTEEEDDRGSRSRSNSGSPPQSASPPQEMKIRVRQISQGVEDISWRNMKAVTPDRDIELEPATPLLRKEEKRGEEGSSDEPAESELSSSVVTTEAADSEAGDKSLKRKLSERGTSQGPHDGSDTPSAPSEPLKRPRDDAEGDDNPRETKRPSPPPEPKSPKSPKKTPMVTSPKLSGFMAYASTSSPFAAVKGQNIFASNKAASPPPVANQTPTPCIPAFSLGSSEASGSSSAFKRSGFESFASSASPFASASRSKSPVLGSASKLGRNKSPPRRVGPVNTSAFSSYASGVQGFAIPPPKRAKAGSPDGSSRGSVERTTVFGANGVASDSGAEDEQEEGGSFGDRLRAGKDEEDEAKSDEENKYMLTEQEVPTGEEDEQTVHQVRGKLFSLVNGNQWKERGTGTLKLNVKRVDGTGARLVMRKEAVYALLLNVTLFPGMRCSLAQDPRYLRFTVIEDGTPTHYNLRLASAKIAKELLEEITVNIPSA
ncbi:putative ran-binding domain containing protein [Lyophyllum shimeji]|uniref:Ran-binding domain containing protein n=1 Tax=Lyophyllum shimeji TaxID=47721 RepID=A0A9P3PTB3_LYOSH|nr:putative ran-binding domain containing protein [Lyophyllum shimeji]